MVFKKIAGILGGNTADEEKLVAIRALTVHGLKEYRETSEEIGRLKSELADATTKVQKQDVEKLLDRVQCRLDALRSAAVVLYNRLEGDVDLDVQDEFGITDSDVAKVSSGFTNNRKSPANEVVQFLIEEAQSDYINGRI